MIGEENISERDLQEGVYQTKTGGPIGETRRLVAAAPMVDNVYGPPATFIIPSDLVVLNGVEKVVSVRIQFDGEKSMPVTLDEPFTVYQLHPNGESNYGFTLTVATEEGEVTAGGQGRIVRQRSMNGDCYDFDPITASIPHFASSPTAGYNDSFGVVDYRIIPGANGAVNNSGNELNNDGCYEGGQPDLACPLVIAPGFSFSGTSSFNDLTSGFGDVLELLQAFGYDVILLNYAKPNDFIERNGLAIRELLVNELPGWMDEDQGCGAMIGISMGTQTARYAMRTAELANEDHLMNLFISLDGPYQGANIPYSLIRAVNFMLPDAAELQPLADTLNSPAAQQMLLKSSIWYQPSSLSNSYYSMANNLGLPQDSRNVAIANGSGTGTLQNNGQMERIVDVELDGPLWTGIWLDARTDHPGRVFYGKINKLFSGRSQSITLGNPDRIDIDPGGWLDIHTEFVDMAADIDDDIEASYELDRFNFIPTSSALGAAFDQTFHHKCNTAHVVGMENEAIQFIGAELLGLLLGSPPPPPVQYQTGCGQPEPGDPLPPTASCTATPNFGIGSVYSTLDGSGSSDPDGFVVNYQWDFDDGTTGFGQTVGHFFDNTNGNAPAFFMVELTVTDDDGLTDTAFCSVEVLCENFNQFFCEQ